MRRLLPLAVLLGCGPPQPPTLSRVQSEVFNVSCNFAACHKGVGSNGLNLESPSHAKMVNVTAFGVDAGTSILVVPGKPDASYLFEKIVKDAPARGARMPNTGEVLDSARIDLVRQWILAGAKND